MDSFFWLFDNDGDNDGQQSKPFGLLGVLQLDFLLGFIAFGLRLQLLEQEIKIMEREMRMTEILRDLPHDFV
ncbi:hypothetical protein TorRG33x02_230490, partial [Trema orientale]